MEGPIIYDCVVLGAGAAGMFCAARAGARGLRVLLVESGDRPGRKILISGGGRCNFTNLHTTHANFLAENLHFAKSALARYTPRDFIALVEKHGIAYHEKTLGQLFCDGSAQRIVGLLERECNDAGVAVQMRTTVVGVTREDDRFRVETQGAPLFAKTVVVATGGLSIPKLGVSGVGYDIARSFGLRIVEPRAALVPFVMNAKDAAEWVDLSGVSAEVVATVSSSSKSAVKAARTPAFREKMLITHRGMSGPAVLQISSYWQSGGTVQMDLVPGADVFTPMLESSAGRDANAAYGLLRQYVSTRLAERWLETNLPADWRNASIEALEAKLHGWSVTPAETEGYAKAEVTAGGVSTAELDSTSLQARSVPGLAFIGEVVDVTGHLGGFNFQWAWASAAAAAAAL